MPGFGNDFETEALDGALPQGQNSPQKLNYGLFAEQLSGSPFTASKSSNERSWLYRIRPSVKHSSRYTRVSHPLWLSAPQAVPESLALGQYRWDAFDLPENKTDFIEGVKTITTAGDSRTHSGMAAHIYLCNSSMENSYLCNADAEMLFVPQQGSIRLVTELGIMDVEPMEIALVPRGMMFKVECLDNTARGYLCENYGAKLTLPERGPIGANCLANPRDFKTPVAHYVDDEISSKITMKWCGTFNETTINHSPLDVVAWHGNYAPYKYDLRTFSPVGAILFDHPDPSIFTVLTAPSSEPGTANIDFVIFPPRWMVAEHTFRPPWYHRNIMSEFMGLITGQYDAKEEGFSPGGISLHNMMLPHGPDAHGYTKATTATLKPVKLEDTMAFMFETHFPQMVSEFAANAPQLQSSYASCWDSIERSFDGTPGEK
jgi:homogentisate 1,2-dioxygenase